MAKYGDKNRYHLTNYEKETIMLYNDDDKIGTVYTCNAALIRKMDKMMAQYPDIISLKREDEVSKTCYVPKNYMKISVPKKMNYTDEQKEKMRNDFIARIKNKAVSS